ncbi:competence protein ComFC [Halolactibacillus alkaliphilus]|nr:competence protein ComFC [Halolactibacillus alkaliphilus]
MRCLLCFKSIEQAVSWHTLFQPVTAQYCAACRPHLTKITGAYCKRCHRPQAKTKTCSDCAKRNQPALLYNRSVYCYDAAMKDMLIICKYRHHYHALSSLTKPVRQAFFNQFKTVKHLTLIPIPVSDERMEERLFNQATIISAMIPRPVFFGLKRHHQEKQAKKNRKQRLQTPNPFYLDPHLPLPTGPVVLIDDVYTTGTTLHHAANVLAEAGIEAIYSFTLAR